MSPQSLQIVGRPRLDASIFLLVITSLALSILVFFLSSIRVAQLFAIVFAGVSAGWAVAIFLRRSVLDIESRTIIRVFFPLGIRLTYPFTDFRKVARVLELEGEGGPYRVDVTLGRTPPQPDFVFTSFMNLSPGSDLKLHAPSQKEASRLAEVLGVPCEDVGFDSQLA